MAKTFKTALDVYYFCYEKGNVTSIPASWYITENFTWNEAFKNELNTDGVPFYDTFLRIYNACLEFQKVRNYLNKPMSVHCFYRSIEHNVRAYIQSGFSKAVARTKVRLGVHMYGTALDFHVNGMSDEAVRQKILQGIKEGKFKVRIESGTNGWVHIDTGNPFASNGYSYGLF